jgi:hypothetical protein
MTNTSVRHCLLAIALSLGCQQDPPDEETYIDDPYPGELGPQAPFCQWRKPPPAPPGTTAHPVSTVRGFPSNVEACKDIDPEVVDGWLREVIDGQCDETVEGFLRGCYTEGNTPDGPGCAFGAYYFSGCEVVLEDE